MKGQCTVERFMRRAGFMFVRASVSDRLWVFNGTSELLGETHHVHLTVQISGKAIPRLQWVRGVAVCACARARATARARDAVC